MQIHLDVLKYVKLINRSTKMKKLVINRNVLLVVFLFFTVQTVRILGNEKNTTGSIPVFKLQVLPDGTIKVYDLDGKQLDQSVFSKPLNNINDYKDNTNEINKDELFNANKDKKKKATEPLQPSKSVNDKSRDPDLKKQEKKEIVTEPSQPSKSVNDKSRDPDLKKQEQRRDIDDESIPSPSIEKEPPSKDLKFQSSIQFNDYQLLINPTGSPNLTLYTGSGSVNTYSFTQSTGVLVLNTSVQNDGSGTAGNFRLGWYLSSNTTISTSDYLVLTQSRSSLTAGYYVNLNGSVDLDDTPVPYGTWYVGIIIDDLGQVAESNEGDNIFKWDNPIVYQPTGTPNLTLYTGSGSVNNYSFTQSTGVLDLYTSVQNNGTAKAGNFRLGWYLSSNTTISTSDYLVCYATQASLTAGYYVNLNGSVDLDATPVPYGTWYVGIIIDDLDQVAETDEGDNIFIWNNPIDYQPTGTPNLTLYTGSGSVNAYSFTQSTGVLDLYTSVQNNGTATAGNFRMGWYLSSNTTISTSDYLVCYATQASLTAGYYVNLNGSVDLDATPVPYGTWYVGIIIDDLDQVAESNESDNIFKWDNSIDYQPTGTPNLTLYTGSGSVNTYSFTQSTGVLDLYTSVQNNGTATAGNFRLGWYLSSNTTISTSDYLVNYATQSSLTAGYYVNFYGSVDLDATPVPYGTWYVGIIIDDLDQVAESNESDNIFIWNNPINYIKTNDIDDNLISNISSFKLLQNYPNPFNNCTNIIFYLPNDEFVKIEITDLDGNIKGIITNQKYNKGIYSINWDASNYPSGVYFYKLTAGEFTATRKCLLIK